MKYFFAGTFVAVLFYNWQPDNVTLKTTCLKDEFVQGKCVYVYPVELNMVISQQSLISFVTLLFVSGEWIKAQDVSSTFKEHPFWKASLLFGVYLNKKLFFKM